MRDYNDIVGQIIRAIREIDVLRGWESDPDDLVRPGGRPATVAELAEAEELLATKLPASYRQYLLEANGGHILSKLFGMMFPCDALQWSRTEQVELVRDWMRGAEEYLTETSEKEHLTSRSSEDPVHFRRAYMPGLLQISEMYEDAGYLLNPAVKDESGEWEAWEFAVWYPGALRFQSFDAMVMALLNRHTEELRLLRLPFDRSQVLEAAVKRAREIMASDKCDAETACTALLIKRRASLDDSIAAWIERETEGPVHSAVVAELARSVSPMPGTRVSKKTGRNHRGRKKR